MPWRPNESEEDFFYRGDFQIKVKSKGRPYFEGLAAREQIEKSQSTAAIKAVADSKNEGNMQPRQLKIFLCHASDDKSIVRELYQRLHSDGFSPWLDSEDLLPGQEWELEIRKAVKTSDVVLVCLSKSSVPKEGVVQKEIRLALDVADEKPEGTIFMIPVKIEPCQIPERLSRLQWVDLSQPDGYDKLFRSLRARAASLGISEPTPTESIPTGLPRATPSQRNHTPESLAERFQDAIARREQEQKAAREIAEAKARFENIAREAAPAEFEKLADMLRTQAESINAKRLQGVPTLKYIPINHRLDAGKFAVELNPFAGLRSYSVTVYVGVHPDAHQFMDEVPTISPIEQTFIATAAESGFAWRDNQGNIQSPEQIVNDALDALFNFLI